MRAYLRRCHAGTWVKRLDGGESRGESRQTPPRRRAPAAAAANRQENIHRLVAGRDDGSWSVDTGPSFQFEWLRAEGRAAHRRSRVRFRPCSVLRGARLCPAGMTGGRREKRRQLLVKKRNSGKKAISLSSGSQAKALIGARENEFRSRCCLFTCCDEYA